MRIPNAVHESQPWRIHAIAAGFRLEDVWALPVEGRAEDFGSLIELAASFDPANADSRPARVLWRVRDRLGALLGLGTIAPAPAGGAGKLPIPGEDATSLAALVPADLRGTAADVRFAATPFEALYRTDCEFAAELSNRTVHAVMHLAWVKQGDGRYGGQMAVYVKPRGLLGEGYMALIRPFRHRIVYPALIAQFERAWRDRARG